MTPLLKVSKINVSYGKLSAVRDASIELHQSKIVTIIGPNGAGKTTLLKALMGMLPYGGAVHMEGDHLDRLDIEERVERGLILKTGWFSTKGNGARGLTQVPGDSQTFIYFSTQRTRRADGS